jgi:hypothetical protein
MRDVALMQSGRRRGGKETSVCFRYARKVKVMRVAILGEIITIVRPLEIQLCGGEYLSDQFKQVLSARDVDADRHGTCFPGLSPGMRLVCPLIYSNKTLISNPAMILQFP